MKKSSLSVFQVMVFLCGLTLLFSGASRLTPAQQGTAEIEPVETRLTKLFDLCQKGDAKRAAAYFVYRGADKSREWKDTFRASDARETAEVSEICRRIKGYLDESESHRFGEVKVERESEGEWHVLEVSFQRGSQIKKALFAFLPIKGQFSIGDID